MQEKVYFPCASHDLCVCDDKRAHVNAATHIGYIPRNTARRTCDGRRSVSCCSASHKQRPARLQRTQEEGNVSNASGGGQ